jgi:hypothetical protein
MGEAKRNLSSTQKFIQKYPSCFFCGGKHAATTREHMPPKSLFDNSHRPDKLVMPACKECNKETSTADLVASIICRWGDDCKDSRRDDHGKLVTRLRRQAPALLDEWTSLSGVEKKHARQHLRNRGMNIPLDAGVARVGPKTAEQLNLFAHKTVLALYFEHVREPFSPSGVFCAFWKSKEDFARDGIPPFLFETLQRYGTITQGRWDARETFEYRYEENKKDALLGCLAKLRKGLFIAGFMVADPSILTDERTSTDWIAPDVPQVLLTLPGFKR